MPLPLPPQRYKTFVEFSGEKIWSIASNEVKICQSSWFECSECCRVGVQDQVMIIDIQEVGATTSQADSAAVARLVRPGQRGETSASQWDLALSI